MIHTNEQFNNLDNWNESVDAGGDVELVGEEVKLSRDGTEEVGSSEIEHKTISISTLGNRWDVQVDLTSFYTDDDTVEDGLDIRLRLYYSGGGP